MDAQHDPHAPLPAPWDRLFSIGTRLFVWGLLAAILWLLRPFLLLLFLTFVFAYVLDHASHGLKRRIRPRPIRVVLIAAVFIGAVSSASVALAPAFRTQAQKIGDEYPQYIEELDGLLDWCRERLPGFEGLLPPEVHADDLIESIVGYVSKDEQLVTLGPEATGEERDAARQAAIEQRVQEKIERLRDIATPILSIAGAFFLSLLFSFLIVLDLPRLKRGARGLRHTKIGFIAVEVGPGLRNFGLMLGRALEAQLFIALCNTILTLFGMWMLGLTDNMIFLATIVFFFSFVPVAGVFISSTPICLDALSEGGVPLFVGAIGMITFVHMVEAYVLNPRIFGHHLRMNPVIVLAVLTVAGKLFGLWGLILGLPVVNYIFRQAIRKDPAAKAPTTPAASPG